MKENLMQKRGLVLRRQTVARMLVFGRGLGLSFGLGGALAPAFGQGYFPTVNPFVDAPSPGSVSSAYQGGIGSAMQVQDFRQKSAQQEYDIKLGPVLANFFTGVTFSYQSNFNQVGSQSNVAAQSLFTVGPTLGVSLSSQISDTAALTLSTGVTYQKSLGQLQYDQVAISPNSILNYQFSVEDVQITLSNSTSTMNQATANPTISGTGVSSLMEFNRLSNLSSVSLAWPVLKETTIGASYAYNINTSIGKDNFQQFDSGMHLFNLSAMQELSPTLSVGLAGTGNIQKYDSTSFLTQQGRLASGQIQNGGTGWSVGPNVRWMMTKAISASANVNYTSQTYDGTGLVADNSNFGGVTAYVSVSHQINKTINQIISGGKSINPGNGSNFTESYLANYGLTWQYIKKSSLNLNFGFNQFTQSGAGFAYVPFDPASPPPSYLYVTENGIAVVPLSSGQVGQQYSATISTAYNITKSLIAGLSYGFIANVLDQKYSVNSGLGTSTLSGYQVNNVVLSLAYQF